MAHPNECECFACKNGIEAVHSWEDEQFAKHGWFIHFVADCEKTEKVDFHTHGLAIKFNHPDLQIVFPIAPNIAQNILWNCFRRIEQGEKFLPYDTAENLIGNGYRVKFIPVKEGEGRTARHLLRIVFPDAAGHLDRNNLSDAFASQYDNTDDQMPVSLNEMKLISDADEVRWRDFE